MCDEDSAKATYLLPFPTSPFRPPRLCGKLAGMTSVIHVRRLGANEAEVFRDIRLEALQAHPAAFAASLEIEREKPLAFFAETLGVNAIFAAWRGDQLLGVAGYYREATPKHAHKGGLWGMYVRKEARGSGAADLLVEAVVRHAKGEVESLHLGVGVHNEPAQRLYRRHGFIEYGREERALKVGDVYFDELMMRLVLRR